MLWRRQSAAEHLCHQEHSQVRYLSFDCFKRCQLYLCSNGHSRSPAAPCNMCLDIVGLCHVCTTHFPLQPLIHPIATGLTVFYYVACTIVLLRNKGLRYIPSDRFPVRSHFEFSLIRTRTMWQGNIDHMQRCLETNHPSGSTFPPIDAFLLRYSEQQTQQPFG